MTMTKKEALEVTAALAAYFPSRLPVETVRAWGLELERFEKDDAIEGVRSHARTATHPCLAELITAIKGAKKERMWREEAARPKLKAPEMTEEDLRRGKITAAIFRDVIEGFLPRDLDWAAELDKRVKMSDDELTQYRGTLQRVERGWGA